MFLSLPAAVALIVGSEQIISALFGYGSFDELSVTNSAKALYYFGLGLPAFALIKVFSTFFSQIRIPKHHFIFHYFQ